MRLYAEAPAGSTSRARTLRRSATDAEKALWRALREKLPEAKWRRQVPVGPYIADLLSFNAKLVIEADGGQHDERADLDARRTASLEANGYRVLRFWNNDILTNMPGVIETIAAALPPSPLVEGRGPSPKAIGRVRFSAEAKTRTSPSHAARGAHPSPDGRGI